MTSILKQASTKEIVVESEQSQLKKEILGWTYGRLFKHYLGSTIELRPYLESQFFFCYEAG